MSHRGYGEPPYPPIESNQRPRADAGRERERRHAPDTYRDAPRYEPWDDDPRSASYGPDDRSSGSDARWSTADDSYEPGSSRSSRSRWSNPPPRRRRGQSRGGRPPLESPPVSDRTTSRSAGAGVYGDPYVDPPYAPDWNDSRPADTWPEEFGDTPRTRRQPRASSHARGSLGRGGGGAARRTPRPTFPTLRVPASLTRVELLHDHVAIFLLSVAALSAIVMAGVLAGRTGDLPAIIALRSDATGAPTRWGTPTSLWELPFLAGMVIIINLVLAWWLSAYDRFAGRFLLATATVVGLLTWIPLVRFLW